MRVSARLENEIFLFPKALQSRNGLRHITATVRSGAGGFPRAA
jgi:hypothetical protein